MGRHILGRKITSTEAPGDRLACEGRASPLLSREAVADLDDLARAKDSRCRGSSRPCGCRAGHRRRAAHRSGRSVRRPSPRPVGHRQRLGLVVRDIERRHAGARDQLLQLERICSRSLASRLDSGSSSSSSWAGAPARARRRRAAAGRRTAGSPAGWRVLHADQAQRLHDLGLDLGGARAAAAPAADRRRSRTVHMRPDRVGLEHHADIALVGRHLHAALGIGHDLAADRDRAAVGLSRPATQRKVVVLPQPDWPSSA